MEQAADGAAVGAGDGSKHCTDHGAGGGSGPRPAHGSGKPNRGRNPAGRKAPNGGTAAGGAPLTTTLTGAAGTAPYSQNYTFAAVPAGAYTLKVEKKGHAPWTESITVGTTNYNCDQLKPWLYGDVTYDGVANVTDAEQIKKHKAI